MSRTLPFAILALLQLPTQIRPESLGSHGPATTYTFLTEPRNLSRPPPALSPWTLKASRCSPEKHNPSVLPCQPPRCAGAEELVTCGLLFTGALEKENIFQNEAPKVIHLTGQRAESGIQVQTIAPVAATTSNGSEGKQRWSFLAKGCRLHRCL